ncbi:hypothetical protein [Streptomyces sp. NPDC018031]
MPGTSNLVLPEAAAVLADPAGTVMLCEACHRSARVAAGPT